MTRWLDEWARREWEEWGRVWEKYWKWKNRINREKESNNRSSVSQSSSSSSSTSPSVFTRTQSKEWCGNFFFFFFVFHDDSSISRRTNSAQLHISSSFCCCCGFCCLLLRFWCCRIGILKLTITDAYTQGMRQQRQSNNYFITTNKPFLSLKVNADRDVSSEHWALNQWNFEYNNLNRLTGIGARCLLPAVVVCLQS